jgi:hypothetical protein
LTNPSHQIQLTRQFADLAPMADRAMTGSELMNHLMSSCVLTFLYLSHPTCAQNSENKAAPECGATQDQAIDKDREGTRDARFPDGLEHEFGKVARGTYCKHAFRIVNTSQSPIEITAIRVASGPVRPRMSNAHLESKEVAKLMVLVETPRFTGSKSVTIYLAMRTGNGAPEEVRFRIICDSDETLKLDPKVALQIRLIRAACKGVDVDRDGFPPGPGGYLADATTPDIVTVLKEGADINMPDQRGYTALMCAASWGLADNVKTLLAHGADATLKTEDGLTALDFAEANYKFRAAARREVASILREHLAKKR